MDTHSTKTQGLVKVRQSTVKTALVATVVRVTKETHSTQTQGLVKVRQSTVKTNSTQTPAPVKVR